MTGGDPPQVVGAQPAGDAPMTGGDLPRAGGQPEGDSPMSGGSPSQAGGIPDGDSPMSGGSPARSGGFVPGDSPMSGGNTTEVQVGNMLGAPPDGSERPSQGGVGLRINGVGFSEKDELDLVTDFPGLELSGQDINAPVPDRRAEATLRVAGEVEVGRVTLNLLNAPSVVPVFSPSGSQARLVTTRLLLVALNVTGPVTTQPEIQLEQAAPGDVLAQVALAFTATGQCAELPANAIRQVVNNAQTLSLGHVVTSAAGAYTVQVIVLGRVIPA